MYGDKVHLGVDVGVVHGTNIHASREGVIEFIDTNPRTGLDVRIVTVINGRLFRHIYEHLLGYQGQKGDPVVTGQLIGWADNTGYSSADHLHFQLEEWNGTIWIPVNPETYMSDLYATDVLWANDKLKYASEQIAILAEKVADYMRK